MKILTDDLVENILSEARKSPRKRAIYNFHKPDEVLQRMINAGLRDTYIQPHKHENPDKLETFLILRGEAAILRFNDIGDVLETVVLNEKGPVKYIEVSPRTWHCVVFLTNEVVLYEIIEGKYTKETHKNFASWAPREGEESVNKYLSKLREIILGKNEGRA